MKQLELTEKQIGILIYCINSAFCSIDDDERLGEKQADEYKETITELNLLLAKN